ncbi:hypothetical protein [Microbacterium sp. NPDC058389]|uniref:hypothetical protein n=1 Tax=Microbacterium sp. NPDC058389 TaxID=3346475 RepID=UPI003655F8D0
MVLIVDCENDPISCQLGRIVEEMSRFDWNDFLSTLIATLVGAAIAAIISVLLYRHESKTRRTAEITDAVVILIKEIQVHSSRTRDWFEELQSFRSEWGAGARIVDGKLTASPPAPIRPDRAGLDTAVETLIVLTKGDDRKIAERVRQVLYELTFIADGHLAAIEYGSVRRVLVSWRAGKRSTQDTLASLQIIDGRRQALEAGARPDTLRPSPEPYERAIAPDAASARR